MTKPQEILSDPNVALVEKRKALLRLVKSGQVDILFRIFQQRTIRYCHCANPFCVNPPIGNGSLLKEQDFRNGSSELLAEWFCSRPACIQGCRNIVRETESQIRDIIETEEEEVENCKSFENCEEKKVMRKASVFKKSVVNDSINLKIRKQSINEDDSDYEDDFDEDKDEDDFDEDDFLPMKKVKSNGGRSYFGTLSMFGKMHSFLSDCFKIRHDPLYVQMRRDLQEQFIDMIICTLKREKKTTFNTDTDSSSIEIYLRNCILEMSGLPRLCTSLNRQEQIFLITLLLLKKDPNCQKWKQICLEYVNETLLQDLFSLLLKQ